MSTILETSWFIASKNVVFAGVVSGTVWIGIESTVAGDFRFSSTGAAVTYFNWAVGEPLNTVGQVYLEVVTGKWRSVPSNIQCRTVCVAF